MPHSTQWSLYDQEKTEILSNLVCPYKTEIIPNNNAHFYKGQRSGNLKKKLRDFGRCLNKVSCQ